MCSCKISLKNWSHKIYFILIYFINRESTFGFFDHHHKRDKKKKNVREDKCANFSYKYFFIILNYHNNGRGRSLTSSHIDTNIYKFCMFSSAYFSFDKLIGCATCISGLIPLCTNIISLNWLLLIEYLTFDLWEWKVWLDPMTRSIFFLLSCTIPVIRLDKFVLYFYY